jgi:glycosyltransferase involved in cell wall biosynthesis
MVQPWGGAERVLEVIAELFPEADLFTLMLDEKVLPPALARRSIKQSFLGKIPGKYRLRRALMPLYPLALEQLDMRGYDLVISSESGPAKGVITAADTCHICYSHSPMRYVWDMYGDYRESIANPVGRATFALAAHYLRMWDLASADRVDWFVANSKNVANRIRKHYRRGAAVIHPPVNLERSYVSDKRSEYYLVLGRLVDYKRVDLAIQACNRIKRPLRIVGDGPQYKALRRMAGPTIEFTGRVPEKDLPEMYAQSRALLFPAEEDFGLVPVEAQSFGIPVIAFGRGGALETVKAIDGEHFRPGATGVFFAEQTPESLINAIQRFENHESEFVALDARANAKRFDVSHFKSSLVHFVSEKMLSFRRAQCEGAGEIVDPVESD